MNQDLKMFENSMIFNYKCYKWQIIDVNSARRIFFGGKKNWEIVLDTFELVTCLR